MKTIVFCLIYFICIGLSKAQVAGDIAAEAKWPTFDVKQNLWSTLPKNMEKGTYYRIRVTNVNRYLYEVKIKVNNKEFKSEPPAILKSIFGSQLTLKDLAETFGSLTESAAGGAPAPTTDDTNKKNARIERFNEALKKFYTTYGVVLKAQREFLKKVLVAYNSHYMENNTIVDPDITAIQNELVTNLNYLRDLDKYYSDVMLNSVEENFQTKQTTALMNLIEGKKLAEQFQVYATGLLNLSKENFRFETSPIEAKPDEMVISVDYSPRKGMDSSFYIPLKSDSISIEVPVGGTKWRWSFSQGLFISSLRNQAYSYKSNLLANATASGNLPDSVQSYSVVRENTNKYNVGIAALAHYTAFVTGSTFGYGLHLGVGLPINKNPLPQLFYGASLSVGKTYRVCLNIGGTTGLVETLSSNFNLDQRFKNTSGVIPLIRHLETGLAASLTFNFFSNK